VRVHRLPKGDVSSFRLERAYEDQLNLVGGLATDDSEGPQRRHEVGVVRVQVSRRVQPLVKALAQSVGARKHCAVHLLRSNRSGNVKDGDGRVDEFAVLHVPQQRRRRMPLLDGVVENDSHLLARKAESKRVSAVVLADPHELLARLHALEEQVLMYEAKMYSRAM
jgi:hypothetical protein